ncbi:MAG TPA: GMC oxidoreductase [Thermoanaerobaculia bacterium]
MSGEEYDYIVVGSGAGGGPLAANLAKRGSRVLLIEAGSDPETYLYQVPCFHAFSTEEKAMAWNFFVHHYSRDEDRDTKFCPEQNGVFYPRAGTLGGCTAHNAMITIVPHDSDWNGIAEVTGDDSWRAERMRPYFQRVQQWLMVNTVDPRMGLEDPEIVQTVIDAAMRGGCLGVIDRIFSRRKLHFDPNEDDNIGAEGLTSRVPLATTTNGRRNSTREYIRCVQKARPDCLEVRMNNLATRVIFGDGNRAVGVECLEGEHLYHADPGAAAAAPPMKREYRCKREVVLAGGAFNTPQLLMLSGIGPKQHLEQMKISCRLDRPGVGSNLQDRYEVAVVSEMRSDFSILSGATFRPPAGDEAGDSCFQQWKLEGNGMYTSNGTVAAIITKSKESRHDPDLFIFGVPGNFKGYYPGYSKDLERAKNFFTWAIIKAHTNNTSGTVRLRSSDPRQTPDINFHYFDEGNDPHSEDLHSVVAGVEIVRQMNARNSAIAAEIVPGPDVRGRQQIAEWVKNNAWGHHASCSSRIGREDDPLAVVDSRFRVIGTQGLRIVDASVFPRIPGFFIVAPIFMISEKATDVITEGG